MLETGRKLLGRLILAAVLLVFWVVVTATLTLYDLALGLACSLVVAVLSFYLLSLDRRGKVPFLAVLRFPLFALALAWEIFLANLDVALIIVRPSLPIDPRVAEYRTRLEGELERAFLADVFTLTPGTVTLQVEGDRLWVHCLAARHEERLRAGGLEKLVAWLFGGKRHA
jgi:multicomponent Na+:H+ antiporter subunit E